MSLLADNILESSDLSMWFSSGYTANSAKIDFCCNASHDAIQKYCSRVFLSSTYTQEIISSGTDQLFLAQFPLISISSLKVDTSELDTALYSYDSSLFSDGIIQLFTMLRPEIKINITYLAGYARNSLPYDLKFACLLQTSYYFNTYGGENNFLGFSEISKMNETLKKDNSLFVGGLLGEVVGIIEKYKRLEAGTIACYRGLL